MLRVLPALRGIPGWFSPLSPLPPGEENFARACGAIIRTEAA